MFGAKMCRKVNGARSKEDTLVLTLYGTPNATSESRCLSYHYNFASNARALQSAASVEKSGAKPCHRKWPIIAIRAILK